MAVCGTRTFALVALYGTSTECQDTLPGQGEKNGHIIAAVVSLCESRASCVWFYATYAFIVYHKMGIDFVLFVPRLGHQQAAAS